MLEDGPAQFPDACGHGVHVLHPHRQVSQAELIHRAPGGRSLIARLIKAEQLNAHAVAGYKTRLEHDVTLIP